MTDRAKFTLEEALAMSNHEFAEAFIDCDIDDVGGRWVQWRAVLEAKLDDVARKAREEEAEWWKAMFPPYNHTAQEYMDSHIAKLRKPTAPPTSPGPSGPDRK